MAGSLGRTGGKVGAMWSKPPVLPALSGSFGGRLTSGESNAEAMRQVGGAFRSSRSLDSNLSIPEINGAGMMPTSSEVSRSPFSRSLSRSGSMDELDLILHRGEKKEEDSFAVEGTVCNKKMAKECLQKGELVPDSVIGGLLRERLSKIDCARHGWLLDGFPRTSEQVDILAENDSLPSVVVVMNVSDDDLVDRLVNRRIDPKTGDIYNLKYKKPSSSAVEKRLTVRDDDREDVIRSRLGTYRKEVPGILANFTQYDVPVEEISAGDGVSREEVHKQIKSVLLKMPRDDILNDSKPLNVVIAGPPGCGKGSQAAFLRHDFGMVHVSTGDLLREVTADARS